MRLRPQAAGHGPVNNHFSSRNLTLSCQEPVVSSSRSGDRNWGSGREYRLGGQFGSGAEGHSRPAAKPAAGLWPGPPRLGSTLHDRTLQEQLLTGLPIWRKICSELSMQRNSHPRESVFETFLVSAWSTRIVVSGEERPGWIGHA